MDDYEITYAYKRLDGVAWDLLEYRSNGNFARPDDGVGVFSMVGDDREHTFKMDDMVVLLPGEWCGECGQIGCRG